MARITRNLPPLNFRNLAKLCTKIIKEKKCLNISLLNTKRISTISDYVIISTVTSSPHMSAVVDGIVRNLKKRGILPLRREGSYMDKWVVLDYGGLILHFMFPEVRSYYALDKLFSSATKLKVE